jgi:uncharacterized SAM-binding protein YcdF (DUF218 family)
MSKRSKTSREHGGAIGSLISLLFLVVLCAVIYFARHPIMRFAAEQWVVDEPAAHADAILLLGDDNFFADRATHAAELFRQGVAPLVVAGGRKLRPSAGISELLEHDLIERGVPKESILRFPLDSESTLDQAGALSRLAKERGWKSVVVVTSNYDTRRTRYIFQKNFPQGIAVRVSSSRDGEFDPENWWTKRESMKLFVLEVEAMAEALWELRNAGVSN